MVANVYSRNLHPPGESFFLFGLRGAGKSTRVRQRFATALHVNLLDEGPLLEGWEHGLLRAHNAYVGLYDELAYWAPSQGGTEVDFMMRRSRAFTAVEVRATTNPNQTHMAGLRAIAELPGIKCRTLVHIGPRPFTTADGIAALPAMLFAEVVATERL